MCDTTTMRLVECVCDLRAVLQDLIERDGAFFKAPGKRFTFYAFHHQVIDSILLTDVEQHTDVRMIQAGDGFCFALKALLANGICGKVSRKNFDRNGAVEARIARAIHLAHSASTKG